MHSIESLHTNFIMLQNRPLNIFYTSDTYNLVSLNGYVHKEDDDMDKFLQFVLSGVFFLYIFWQNNYKFRNSAFEKINSFIQNFYLKVRYEKFFPDDD